MAGGSGANDKATTKLISDESRSIAISAKMHIRVHKAVSLALRINLISPYLLKKL